ncbi:MAG TPA: hypothetical protein VIZ61_15025 [Solirubrobacterales bacterium]
MRTPVALILFRRPELTAEVFERIRDARPSKLFLIADAPRPGEEEEARACEEARAVVERVDWPCEVVRDYADENLGLKRRFPSGLDRVFSEAEEAIVLEDDCLPHASFFSYCDELLERYRDDERVVHIAGSQLLPRAPVGASYHFSRYVHVWGWATWRRAWNLYDPELTDWQASSEGERDGLLRATFEAEDERRFWRFVWDNVAEIDNWDAQWSYVALSRGLLAVNPNRNLISNVGFAVDATNATADPLGIARRPLEGMDFPLSHPAEVSRDAEADALASRLFRRPAPPFWYRVASRLLRRSPQGAGR